MNIFNRHMLILIFGSLILNGCSTKVEDFTLLRFEQAKVFIFLPYRLDSYRRTKLYIKEISDDIVVDGDTVARVYEEKKVFHFSGKGIIVYGDARIEFDNDKVFINRERLGAADGNYYYYLLSPDGSYKEGIIREIW